MITATVKHNDNYTDIEFPCSEAYLSAKLMEIHVDDLSSTTHYISAVTEPKELSFLKDRLVNLDELNYLAKRMDSFFGDEETQFFEAIKLEHFTRMKDLINMTFNLDKYTLIKDVSDMGKVGREYLLNTEGCIPAHDEDNPKYAEIGRELLRSGRGIFTEHGLLFPDQNRPFEELYNGKTFPAYIYDQCLFVGEIEYEGQTEFIYLPDDERAIQKAFRRLGAETPENCSVILTDFCSEHNKMFDLFKNILNNEGIYTVNSLAQTVNNFVNPQDLKKLSAVLEYADVSDSESVAALAENLDTFGYAQGINDCADLGRWWIDNHDELQLSIELEDYFDYDQFGSDIHEEYSGTFLADENSGYVYIKYGRSLQDILDRDEDEGLSMGGM